MSISPSQRGFRLRNQVLPTSAVQSVHNLCGKLLDCAGFVPANFGAAALSSRTSTSDLSLICSRLRPAASANPPGYRTAVLERVNT
jgi:hypothetical protein